MPDHALFNRLKDKADSLQNGHNGDLGLMSDVIGDMAYLLVSIASDGCFRYKTHVKSSFGWPACVATITGIGVVMASVLAIVEKLSQ